MLVVLHLLRHFDLKYLLVVIDLVAVAVVHFATATAAVLLELEQA